MGPARLADRALTALGTELTQHGVLTRQHRAVLLLTLKAFHRLHVEHGLRRKGHWSPAWPTGPGAPSTLTSAPSGEETGAESSRACSQPPRRAGSEAKSIALRHRISACSCQWAQRARWGGGRPGLLCSSHWVRLFLALRLPASCLVRSCSDPRSPMRTLGSGEGTAGPEVTGSSVGPSCLKSSEGKKALPC